MRCPFLVRKGEDVPHRSKWRRFGGAPLMDGRRRSRVHGGADRLGDRAVPALGYDLVVRGPDLVSRVATDAPAADDRALGLVRKRDDVEGLRRVEVTVHDGAPFGSGRRRTARRDRPLASSSTPAAVEYMAPEQRARRAPAWSRRGARRPHRGRRRGQHGGGGRGRSPPPPLARRMAEPGLDRLERLPGCDVGPGDDAAVDLHPRTLGAGSRPRPGDPR